VSAFISPQLPVLTKEPPTGPDWVHEIKHDGFRALIAVDRGRARAFTRNGHDWTGRYRPIATACETLPCSLSVIDGERIVEDADGCSDFSALPKAIDRAPHRLVFPAFDPLQIDGKDLRKAPLIERRQALADLTTGHVSHALRYSEHFEGDGAAFFVAAVKHGFEGIHRRAPIAQRPVKAVAQDQKHD
jgi:bifunctional non-homologous end joining protein LigD